MKRKNKKKFNFKRFLLFILVVILLVFGFKYLLNLKIKNIIVLNNNYYNDETIIETAGLDNYPKYILLNKNKIRNNLLKLDLIEDVKVSKKNHRKVILDIIEKKILYYDRGKELYITSNGKYKLSNILGIPTLINYVPSDIEEKFINKFKNIDKDVISIISEIEYSKTDYDDNRFLLTMNDGNQVYVTVSKLDVLNKYIDIIKELDNKKGILYLDSGNYFEVKSK